MITADSHFVGGSTKEGNVTFNYVRCIVKEGDLIKADIEQKVEGQSQFYFDIAETKAWAQVIRKLKKH